MKAAICEIIIVVQKRLEALKRLMPTPSPNLCVASTKSRRRNDVQNR